MNSKILNSCWIKMSAKLDAICDNPCQDFKSRIQQSIEESYNVAFVKTNLDEFKCGICLELVIEPTTVLCGHTFCHQCIEFDIKKCPTCRHPVGSKIPAVNVSLNSYLKQNAGPEYIARVLEVQIDKTCDRYHDSTLYDTLYESIKNKIKDTGFVEIATLKQQYPQPMLFDVVCHLYRAESVLLIHETIVSTEFLTTTPTDQFLELLHLDVSEIVLAFLHASKCVSPHLLLTKYLTDSKLKGHFVLYNISVYAIDNKVLYNTIKDMNFDRPFTESDAEIEEN